ncbi:hypothetical protein [Thiohalomonas denitrificans]|uniref:HMA domain-containing protein n=1 Tax=Thiohalomonas denitrificans TaxID=415747 RepID=A0A1G5QER5_9GAMM|nr:hypothetical protein [Thiohalomonas denitrificans]SCZ60353.1 hypothetical protein SAMN03097708_02038 [Thiohalomonas denitrificans]
MVESVSRGFRLREVNDSAIGVAQSLPGVLAARNAGAGKLKVTYDIAETDYRTLQEALRRHGYPGPTGRLQRLRDSWYQFQDENRRANLEHKPACCSKPPPGASRRK